MYIQIYVFNVGLRYINRDTWRKPNVSLESLWNFSQILSLETMQQNAKAGSAWTKWKMAYSNQSEFVFVMSRSLRDPCRVLDVEGNCWISAETLENAVMKSILFFLMEQINQRRISCVGCCNALERTATHCHTLQHTATHCNTLQHTAINQRRISCVGCCNALQRTATHCNTLHHTATHCNTLQHTAINQRHISCVGCWG